MKVELIGSGRLAYMDSNIILPVVETTADAVNPRPAMFGAEAQGAFGQGKTVATTAESRNRGGTLDPAGNLLGGPAGHAPAAATISHV